VTTYLPGVLASDLPADPEHHRQAGGLLRRFHGQATRWAPDWERRRTEQALAQLDAPHALDRDAVLAAATWLTAQRPASTALVPTHGDYRPRNWLVHEGVLRVIDLGRAGWRPASADLLRLSAQEWRGRPDLEEAFLDGYGADPRTADAWRLMLVREAIGAAVWGHRADDPVVEAEAGRMLRGLLP
jgi:aminoglycoside phosphotransferase (APT) family kinase protein